MPKLSLLGGVNVEKYKLIKKSLTGILLAVSATVASPNATLYTMAKDSIEKDIESDCLHHDHAECGDCDHDHLEDELLETLSLKGASNNPTTKKVVYKSDKNGTHIKTVKTTVTKDDGNEITTSTKKEKCNIVPQIEFIDNNNGKYTIKFYRGCTKCNYKLKVYKKIVVGDYDDDSIRDYYDKKDENQKKKLKNEFTILTNKCESIGKSNHNRKIKVKLKNGKTYTVNIKEKCSLIPNIEFTDNLDGTHDIEFYRECDDCGYTPKIFRKTGVCKYDEYEHCEYCDSIKDNDKEVELKEKNNFQIIENSYQYNDDGTHTRTIKVKLKNGKIYSILSESECDKIIKDEYKSNGDGTHTVLTSEDCRKCHNHDEQTKEEKCSYKDDKCTKCNSKNIGGGNHGGSTNDHEECNFVLTDVEYESTNNGKHIEKRIYECSCGKTKIESTIFDCKYDKWISISDSLEKGECKYCEYEVTRKHSLNKEELSTYDKADMHIKKVREWCSTCDYEKSSSYRESCNYVDDKCSDCGHVKEISQDHNHKFDKVISTKTTYNGDGTHTTTTQYGCACGKTKTETKTANCNFGAWISNGAVGEKCTCLVCKGEKTRKHKLNKTVTSTYIGNDKHNTKTTESCATCDYTNSTEKEENCNYVDNKCSGCKHEKDINKDHDHKFDKVISTKTIYNGDGTHTTTTKYGCTICEGTKTETKTANCNFGAWVSNGIDGEKCICPVCKGEKTRKHKLNTSTSYTSLGNGKHKIITTESCLNCDYTNSTEKEEDCSYGAWVSNGATGERCTCPKCKDEKTRNHSLNIERTAWVYVSEDIHKRTVNEECTTCDYTNSYDETSSCKYGNEYTLSDGLTVVADCPDCGHQDVRHTHDLQYSEESVANNPNICYNSITSCKSCEYKVTTPIPHSFADNGFEDEGEKQQECSKCGATKWVPITTTKDALLGLKYMLLGVVDYTCVKDCLREDDRKVFSKK